jgi:hypothetical protein
MIPLFFFSHHNQMSALLAHFSLHIFHFGISKKYGHNQIMWSLPFFSFRILVQNHQMLHDVICFP